MAAPTTLARQPDPQASAAYGLAYYRVSTSEQANTSFDDDGFSIQAQRDYCQRKAAELGVQLVDEYTDRGKSARTADRPALQAMLARIKEDTDIQYVFVHKLDRLARNREDDVQISLTLAKHGVRLVSCTENIDDSPSGKLVRGIMADIAEWYSANLSQEAKKGMLKKAEAGGTPGNVPLGYINARLKITELGKDIGVVQVHETYGPLITECFKLYDTGLCTIGDVVAHATDQGLRLAANRRLPERPLRVQHMQRILRNRYYTGWVSFGGVAYQGEHPALIDEATFDRVQALLTARNLNKDKSRKRPHHLKGSIFCARCGRRFGICAPTKKRSGVTYPYFYCLGRQNGKNDCPQTYIPIGDVEDAVRAYWAEMRIPAGRVYALRQAILDEFTGKHEQGQAEIAKQRRRITELEQRRKKAKAAYYADVLDLGEFKTEQETIRQGIQAAEDIMSTWNVELDGIRRSLDEALALVENPQRLYDALPEGLKLVLVQTVFEKVWILDTKVVGSDLTQPFAELLTLEARLALVKRRQAATDMAAAPSDEGATYFRQRATALALFSSLAESWERPYVERPRGPLPIDAQNLGPIGGRGSNMQQLVGVTRFKLNHELAMFIHDHANGAVSPPNGGQSTSYHRPKRRIRERLSVEEIATLVADFKAGTPKRQLAAQYGMNLSSVKKLLREEGVRGTQHGKQR